jgi:ACR3 family arsenite efflux pump ArsB
VYQIKHLSVIERFFIDLLILFYNIGMFINQKLKSIAKIGIHVVYLTVISILIWHINFIYGELNFQNKQSLQFNGRTNNLEGCFKNQDYTCPENKYFNASQFMQ